MAGLRDEFGISVANPNIGRIVDEARAADMGSLRRGWESGRIGTELNPLRTQALDAKIAGDAQRQAELDAQVSALEQRQQMYAPRVSDLRDTNGGLLSHSLLYNEVYISGCHHPDVRDSISPVDLAVVWGHGKCVCDLTYLDHLGEPDNILRCFWFDFVRTCERVDFHRIPFPSQSREVGCVGGTLLARHFFSSLIW